MAEGGNETTIEDTPTWIIAVVCTVIVAISLAVERILHYAGKYLKKKNQKPLYEALIKIKEELMLLGFISLLLTVFQTRISKICIPKHLANHWLPCTEESQPSSSSGHGEPSAHFQGRHLLSEGFDAAGYCGAKGKVPLLSLTALHHLHIFIFVLAVVHVTFCALTIIFGGAKIRQWKHWEDSISKRESDPEGGVKPKFMHLQDHNFVRRRFVGIGKLSTLLGWLHSFLKQFYGSVDKSDYTTMRLGFIMTHYRGRSKFNFHNYMMRVLESDFKKVVGISWYLWLFVVVFLLLNVHGWHAYFWISFVPFILLLAVGAKLEHVITQLAHDVAEKHAAIEGDLVVKPSDDHFWFHKPRLVLHLIHIILFQNSFELAIFFWIWVQYGFNSCIMGNVAFVIPRLVIGVFVQFLCSYSTLPLYAIVTQMGSSFKKEIFEEHIQVGLTGWAQRARQKGLKKAPNNSSQVEPRGSSHSEIHLAQRGETKAATEGNAAEIIAPDVSNGTK